MAPYLSHLAASGRSMATIEQTRATAGMQKGANPARLTAQKGKNQVEPATVALTSQFRSLG